VSSCPQWSTTAPWNFSAPPRPFRHWKYCTVSLPWATAWRLLSRCIPGRLSLATGIQLVALGTLSMSMKGFPPFMQRLMSWVKAVWQAIAASPGALCHSG